MEVKGNSVKRVPCDLSSTSYDAVRGHTRKPVKRTLNEPSKLRMTLSQQSDNRTPSPTTARN